MLKSFSLIFSMQLYCSLALAVDNSKSISCDECDALERTVASCQAMLEELDPKDCRKNCTNSYSNNVHMCHQEGSISTQQCENVCVCASSPKSDVAETPAACVPRFEPDMDVDSGRN